MLPGLGDNLKLEVELVVKPRHEFQSMAYEELGLPKAPAIMLGAAVLVEGRDIEEQELENLVNHHLAGR
ncbi:MAG: hypothetical protein R6W72_03070 [Desulfurivibrionaceae bacterium]